MFNPIHIGIDVSHRSVDVGIIDSMFAALTDAWRFAGLTELRRTN